VLVQRSLGRPAVRISQILLYSPLLGTQLCGSLSDAHRGNFAGLSCDDLAEAIIKRSSGTQF
jgi:hypothetical protein